jgi:signal transduction histidine kinase
MTHRLWYVFGVGALALVAAMVWVSAEMLDLEAAETNARADAGYQERLRLALYRLDYTFSRLLAGEADRDPTQYAPYSYPQGMLRARDLKKLRQKEVLAESPLVANKPPFIRLHFQVDAAGRFTSPQVLTGQWVEAAEDFDAEANRANARQLEEVRRLVDPQQVDAQMDQARKQTAAQTAQVSQSKRAQVVAEKKGLESLWKGDELVFLRRVTLDGEPYTQGFLVDWPRLHAILKSEIEDLFPDATLRPATDETTDRRLFTLPVVLDAPRPAAMPLTQWTATHTVLAFTWAVVLAGLGAAGLALRKSIEFGERQRRFASLVTHELRSPLTTFRLYSDLLAEGMVKEKEKRATYHRTLQRESGHMTRMVENVIAHSRLEEGRAKLIRERILLTKLLDDMTADLTACAEQAGAELTLDAGGVSDVALETDPAAVGQILRNLVENACKYGAPPILVAASVHHGTLRLSVRDHGPGVPPPVARRIFRPFERGARDETDPVRGLGLGLALSRGLAHDLGGDLTLDPPPTGGACFVLTLPIAG